MLLFHSHLSISAFFYNSSAVEARSGDTPKCVVPLLGHTTSKGHTWCISSIPSYCLQYWLVCYDIGTLPTTWVLSLVLFSFFYFAGLYLVSRDAESKRMFQTIRKIVRMTCPTPNPATDTAMLVCQLQSSVIVMLTLYVRMDLYRSLYLSLSARRPYGVIASCIQWSSQSPVRTTTSRSPDRWSLE